MSVMQRSALLPNRACGPWEASLRKLGTLALALWICLLGPITASAQSTGINIIRDAEIEKLLQDYARPLFKAAGVRSSSLEIFLVPDPSFNAFVADGQKMFINTGALLQATTPNEMIGVMAHETGHIAGSHLAGLRQI